MLQGIAVRLHNPSGLGRRAMLQQSATPQNTLRDIWGSRGRRFKSCQPDRVSAGQRLFPQGGGLFPFPDGTTDSSVDAVFPRQVGVPVPGPSRGGRSDIGCV